MKRISYSDFQIAGFYHRGVTLLEVLLAIAVFAFGMLALAHLQSNIARNATDSNTRTVAANIAEEIIERASAWRQLGSDLNNPTTFPTSIFAYDDLTGTMTASIPRGGVDYAVSAVITDYYYDDDSATSFTTVVPTGSPRPDFKMMDMTINWTPTAFIQGDQSGSTAGTLGSGSITVAQVIPSIPSLGSGKILAEDDGNAEGPPTQYTPGTAPDVLRLELATDRFKESSSPVPDIIRSGEITETWFDVVTYNQVGTGDAEFVRREEFVALSCQCELNTNAGGDEVGFYPTIWDGAAYNDRDAVAKPYGESASNQQSIYCDVCCRDHHDGASTSADDRYDGTSGGPGNHAHYDRNNQGNLVLAGNGDDYNESCRLIRKDGFFRVTQDVSLEGYNAFPELYLDGASGSSTYTGYVIDAVEEYYDRQVSPPPGASFPTPTELLAIFPASTPLDGTDLPTALNSDSQQLRSRGIYVDYLGTEAAAIVDCMHPTGENKTGPECGAPDSVSWLEAYPFFDIQLTFLADWEENSGEDPVSMTNEPVETDNTHSKGFAELETATASQVTVTTTSNKGNIGLSASDPVAPGQDTNVTDYYIYVDANGSGPPSPPTGAQISGDILSSVGGVQAASAALTSSTGVTCSRNGNQFTCIHDFLAPQPQTLTLSGYYKNGNTDLWACVNKPELQVIPPVYVQSVPKSTTWTLPLPSNGDLNGVVITISNSACP